MKKHNNVKSIIWEMTWHHKLLSLGILLSVIGAIVFSLLPPLVLGLAVDNLTKGISISVYWIVLYFVLILLTGIMESCRESLLIVYGQKITHALRNALYDKLSVLEASVLYKQEAGALSSRFVSDVNTVEDLFTSGIISLFADACKIVSILVIVWIKNKGLAILFLVFMPILYLFTRIVQKRMLKAQYENREAIEKVTNHVPESIHCIRTIHTLHKEKYMEDRYDTYLKESYEAIDKTNFYDSIYSPVILIINAILVAIVMLMSSSNNPDVLTFFGMSAGSAVAIINYIGQIFSPIESLGMEIQTIQSAMAGVSRIHEFLSLQDTWPTKKNLMFIEDSNCVSFEHVVFGYDEKRVLQDLSFQIQPSSMVTLIGRTGAGKSTIFKLLLGLYKPDSGNVLIYGMKAEDIPDKEKRNIFGYVEQSFQFVSGNIKDQITLFDETIDEDMVIEASKLVGIHDAITHLENGYDTVCTSSIFSQGQWQLLAIARAIVTKPKILLLDEITANLDADTEQSVLKAIKEASKGRTVISISHRIYEHTGGSLIEI